MRAKRQRAVKRPRQGYGYAWDVKSELGAKPQRPAEIKHCTCRARFSFSSFTPAYRSQSYGLRNALFLTSIVADRLISRGLLAVPPADIRSPVFFSVTSNDLRFVQASLLDTQEKKKRKKKRDAGNAPLRVENNSDLLALWLSPLPLCAFSPALYGVSGSCHFPHIVPSSIVAQSSISRCLDDHPLIACRPPISCIVRLPSALCLSLCMETRISLINSFRKIGSNSSHRCAASGRVSYWVSDLRIPSQW